VFGTHRILETFGGSWQLGFCKLQAATTYGGLSGLSVGDTVRRGELVVDFARMAAFRALVLWTLRLTHRCDGRPVCGRRKAHQGARPLATRRPGSRAGDHAPLPRHDACPDASINRDRLPRAGAHAAAAASTARAQRRAGRIARAKGDAHASTPALLVISLGAAQRGGRPRRTRRSSVWTTSASATAVRNRSASDG